MVLVVYVRQLSTVQERSSPVHLPEGLGDGQVERAHPVEEPEVAPEYGAEAERVAPPRCHEPGRPRRRSEGRLGTTSAGGGRHLG